VSSRNSRQYFLNGESNKAHMGCQEKAKGKRGKAKGKTNE